MKKLIILITLAVVFILTACGRSGDAADMDSFFRWVTGSVDTTINPHASLLFANGEMVDLVLVPLYGWMPSLDGSRAELVPMIALSEPESDCGYVWIIRINPEARWQNGANITAEDFIFSWRMGLNPGLAYPSAVHIFGGPTGGQIEVVMAQDYFAQDLYDRAIVDWDYVGFDMLDEMTLKITTARSYTAMDVMLHFSHRATAPVYASMYLAGMNVGGTSTLYGTELSYFMGNGPFVLTSWTKGSEAIFIRNEYFIHADRVFLDGIHRRVATDENARIELFESGLNDMLEIGVTGLMRYEDDPRLISFERQAIHTIEVNQNHPDFPILANPGFRRALYHATDRETVAGLTGTAPAPFILSTVGVAFADGILYRDTHEATYWLPENYGFDPEYARNLMNLMLELYGMDNIALTMIYAEDTPGIRAAAAYLQFDWQRIFGEDVFTLNLRGMPHSAALATMRTSQEEPSGQWELGWSRFMPRAEAFAPHQKFATYLNTNPSRLTWYNNYKLEELFPLFETDRYRFNYQNRLELTARLERYFILENATAIPVVQDLAFILFSSRVELPIYAVSPVIGFAWWYGNITNRD
ncbi:MAG: ABC transporter substrate-binding protein [Defluviitaleaceae bacterium]|nr:ABC transporter substrate-binding protein [Defluviitaleaceae bacterium]